MRNALLNMLEWSYILGVLKLSLIFCFSDVNITKFQHNKAESPSSLFSVPNDQFADAKEILEKSFARLARDEMGVMALQAAFDGMKYRKVSVVGFNRDVDILTSQLSRRFRDYAHIVTSTKSVAARLYKSHKASPLTPRFDCCNLSERELRMDLVYGCRVSRRKCCDLIPRSLSSVAFNPGHNLTRRFQQQLDYWPNVKWFYFITNKGLHTEFPAHNFQCTITGQNRFGYNNNNLNDKYNIVNNNINPLLSQFTSLKSSFSLLPNSYHCHNLHQFRHRDIFVRSIVPEPIWMIIILDQGEASQTQLLLGQRVARVLLASLCEKDYLSVLVVSDTVQSGLKITSPLFSKQQFNNHTGTNCSENLIDPQQTKCKSSYLNKFSSSIFGGFHEATEETKLYLDHFIETIHRPLPIKTNHTQALISAFQIIESSYEHLQWMRNNSEQIQLPSMENILLAYISRGYLTDLNEATTTLKMVANYQSRLENRVRISTYLPIEEKSATVLFEQTFMNDLATRWHIYSPMGSKFHQYPKFGHFFPINRTTDLSDTVGRFYEVFLPRSIKHSTSSSSSVDYVKFNKHDDDDDDSNDNWSNSNINSSSIHNYSEDVLSPIQFSLPYRDLEGGDLVMSISQAFYVENEFIGVMGIDIHLLDIIDDLLHFTGSFYDGGAGSSVAFLIHSSTGRTISHPTLIDYFEKKYPTFIDKQFLRSKRSAKFRSSSSSTTHDSWLGKNSEQFNSYENDPNNFWTNNPNENQYNSYTTNSGNYRHSRPILNPDISKLELIPGFLSHVRNHLLNESAGQISLLVKLTYMEMELYGVTGIVDSCRLNDTTSHTLSHFPLRIVYRWKRILNPQTPFIVVIRSVESLCSEYYQLLPLVPDFEFHYHRLDLLKQPPKCIYLNQLATFNYGTIYLSPRAFARPFTRITQGYLENLNDIRHLIAYLFDHTVLISDPGLASTMPSIRSSVAVVERIGKFWGHRSHTSELRDFIVRRYVATKTGVMLTYPGILMSNTYDPTNRIWYKRALALPERLVFTGPYLDDGGAGYIITLSRAIFEGNQTGIHQLRKDRIAAVIAMDVTYRFLNLILSYWIPECGVYLKHFLNSNNLNQLNSMKFDIDSLFDLEIVSNFLKSRKQYHYDLKKFGNDIKTNNFQSNLTNLMNNTNFSSIQPNDPIQLRCLLMDDRGYLIAHPNFYDHRQNGPIERNHLNYLEPIIAADLLNYDKFVQKSTCIDYMQKSLQRYYVFNLSITEPIQNSLSGEQCIEYKLWSIPNTNLFFGQIEEHRRFGCSPRNGFCPCSTKNRLCLNCIRIEPQECECPCECPIDIMNEILLMNSFQIPKIKTNSPNISFTSFEVLINNSNKQSYFDNLFNYPPCPKLLDTEFTQSTTPYLDASFVRPLSDSNGNHMNNDNNIPPLCQLNNNNDRYGAHTRTQQTLFHNSDPTNNGDMDDLNTDNSDINTILSRCSQRSHLSCTVTVGCEWCITTLNNNHILDKPFCAPISSCFNGVVGASLPKPNFYDFGTDWSANNQQSYIGYSYSVQSHESIQLHKLSGNNNKILQNNQNSEFLRTHKTPFDLLTLITRHSQMTGKIIPMEFYTELKQTNSYLQPKSNYLNTNVNNNGVAGGVGSSNNNDHHHHNLYQPNSDFSKFHKSIINSPIGSVIGAILASLILFILFIYIIKHQNYLRAQLHTNCMTITGDDDHHHNSMYNLETDINNNSSGLNQTQTDKYQSLDNKSDRDGENLNFVNSDHLPPPPPPPAPPTVGLVCVSMEETTTANSYEQLANQSDSESSNPSLVGHVTHSKCSNLSTSPISSVHLNSKPLLSSTTNQSSYWSVENCLEKVKLLINNYENQKSPNTNIGNELSNLNTEFSQTNTLYSSISIPPNPYHVNSNKLNIHSHSPVHIHLVQNTSTFNQHLSEPDDSALGSDCATAISCNSSSTSKIGLQKTDCELGQNQPLGICIGTLILGPISKNKSESGNSSMC